MNLYMQNIYLNMQNGRKSRDAAHFSLEKTVAKLKKKNKKSELNYLRKMVCLRK